MVQVVGKADKPASPFGTLQGWRDSRRDAAAGMDKLGKCRHQPPEFGSSCPEGVKVICENKHVLVIA
jgi:hypothetical protein